MNILITAGATREPIDDVRFISNVSSGATGAALADALAAAGHAVTLLRGIGSVPVGSIGGTASRGMESGVVGAALRRDSQPARNPNRSRHKAAPAVQSASRGDGGFALRQVEFSSAADLSKKLRAELATGRFDAVIMTAAVSDYRVAAPTAGKLPSASARLTLRLVRNSKLLPQLKSWSPRPLVVVGFKLTSRAGPHTRRAAVGAQFATGGVDAVVHNDLAEIRQAARARHPFWLYAAPGEPPVAIAGAAALAMKLARLLARCSRGR